MAKQLKPDYKFNEGTLIEEFHSYIDSTYQQHYGQGGLQSSEVIIDRGHGLGFFLGNVDKYNARYGKKYFAKWAKVSKSSYAESLCEYYSIGKRVAAEYEKVLTKEQLKTIKKWFESREGGKTK